MSNTEVSHYRILLRRKKRKIADDAWIKLLGRRMTCKPSTQSLKRRVVYMGQYTVQANKWREVERIRHVYHARKRYKLMRKHEYQAWFGIRA